MDKKKIMKWVIIIAIIIIPVMYSFFYLKAFWDPYGNLKDMKIAIVNLDEGDENDNIGNELVKTLEDKDVMTIKELKDSDEAQKGLVNQDYYATITIPKDFTKTLNNAANSDRQMATITYSPNQKNNYLASQMINQVVNSVEKEVKGQVAQKVVTTLSDELRSVPDKMQEIADGATQLASGASELNNGLGTLKDGTNTLATNYQTFDEGVDSASKGSTDLNSGLAKLQSGADTLYAGTSKLAESTKDFSKLGSGVEDLASGANTLNSSVSAYVDGVSGAVSKVKSSVATTKTQATTLGTSLQAYVSQHPEAANDANFKQAMATLKSMSSSSADLSGLQTLETKGSELKAGANKLNSNIKTLSSQTSKLSELSSGIQSLNTGMLELKQGLASAKEGSTSLQSGLNTLSTSSKQVKDGINQVNSGASQAYDGSNTLLEGTKTFENEINNGITDTKAELTKLDGLDTYVKEPVKVEESEYGKVTSYGLGFAPYFMSISLWVGGLIALVMLYNDPENRFKIMSKNAKNPYLRTAMYMAIAAAQGVVLGFILKLGLGYSVTNMALYYGTCILISMTFTSIILFLIENFSDVGKFLCILLLVLQLAASGGTFPIETVPKFFQSIYAYMPMNYSIRLIKEALIKTDNGMVGQNAGILIGILVTFIVIVTIIEFLKQKNKNKTENSET